MEPSNIRDLLTSFSPSLDFFAISSGDGRIKIWDTVKGQIQTEFADLVSSETSNILSKPSQNGHLSVDYTCMKWLSLEKKKKRKLGSSLLVLGTGSGDVMALDISAGHLKWSVSDCHPGGVSSISFPTSGSSIFTGGADGMICELDSSSGNLLGKFRASSKGISSVSISPDKNILASAASQIKIFNCSDHKKLQKFSGHPGSVRCMIFSEDGRFVLSSAVGERYVAVWQIDGGKKQSACCVLAMDHPAIFLDSKCIDNKNVDDEGLSVLAISEAGVCYFWHGMNIEELCASKPTKISISFDDSHLKNHKGATPTVFAAKLQGIAKPASGHIFLAYGSIIKPSFDKIVVQSGADIRLNSSLDGILLPTSQFKKSKKVSAVQSQVTALDRSNQDALLPMPKIFDLVDESSEAKPVVSKVLEDNVEVDTPMLCVEDQLRSLGILSDNDNVASSSTVDPKLLKGIDLKANVPLRKMRAAVISMVPSDAYDLLKALVAMWQSRSYSGKFILPWICCILVNHSNYITSQEPVTQLLDSLHKLAKSKGPALHSLLQLSGRLQLLMAPIDKATNNKNPASGDAQLSDESENEDVDEVLFGVDDEKSQTSSDCEG